MHKCKDRVLFRLPSHYFCGGRQGMGRNECKKVLYEAFGLSVCASEDLMEVHSVGFRILCTSAQFGRFIVYRHKYGNCINGIRDLEPELVPACIPDVPSYIAEIANNLGITRGIVAAVLRTANISDNDVRDRMNYPRYDVDVSAHGTRNP